MKRIASEDIVKLSSYQVIKLLRCNMERLKERERLKRRMNQEDLLQTMKFTIICPRI
jgi:hypothetical protein